LIKKKYIVTACLVVCLIVTFLAILINTVGSQPLIPYDDPWLDVNEDGKIDILDIKLVKLAFGSSGKSTGVRALLLELNASVAELEARVSDLESQGLGFLPPPAYDSGWVTALAFSWTVLEHGLNTTEVLVYLTRNDSRSDISHYHYGESMDWRHLSENNITVWFNYPSGEFRVQIWKISEP